MIKTNIKYLLQALAERSSFRAQFNDRIFHRFLSGRMIFLYGTSTAGKSSIANYLKIQTKDDDMDLAITGTDNIWEMHIFDAYLQYSPTRANILLSHFTLKEIFECIWNSKMLSALIKERSIDTELGIVIQTIFGEFRAKQNDLMQSLSPSKRPFFCSASFLPALNMGQVVIVDTAAGAGDIDEFYQAMTENLIHCRTDVVIIYCSPKRLMAHLHSRNKQALSTSSLNNARPGAFPLTQYSAMYEKTDLNCKAIDCIDVSDIQVPPELPVICKTLSEQLAEELGSSIGTYDDGQWTKAEDMMKNVFGINSPTDRSLIKPKSQYQFLVNAGVEDIETCGEKVLNTLRIRY